MVEIPKIGYRLWNDENYQYVSVTEDPNKDGYCYYAHSLEAAGDCDKIYYGTYLGYADSNNLYSRSGFQPTVDTSLTDFRTYAANRGTGYSLESFFPRTLMQCLYVIMYKNLNSQAALGQGYTDASRMDVLGTTLSQPFCYGDPNDGTRHMKFLGIEDMWGNLGQLLDGLYCDGNFNIKTDYKNSVFTDETGDNFQFSTPTTGFVDSFNITSILGTNTSGFVAKSTDSNFTYYDYFSDYSYIPMSGFACQAGGSYSDYSDAGAFRLVIGAPVSYYNPTSGARLMYKHLASSGGGQQLLNRKDIN